MLVNKATIKTADDKEFTLVEHIPIPCFRCGVCCTHYHVPVTLQEIENIASALGMAVPEFTARYVRAAPVKEGYLLRRNRGGCVFLSWDEDGRARCAIHPHRPKACREWIPALSKPECLEGLSRLKSHGQIMLPTELFSSEEELKELYHSLENRATASSFSSPRAIS
jgi:Fe-S-cluster containining protein